MISILDITNKNFHRYEEDILKIENASFHSPWNRNNWASEIDNPVSRIWGLTIDHELVGYICFWIFTGEIHLLNIAIQPKNRRAGLGRLLLNKMIDTGTVQKTDTVWLEVRPSNYPAIRLYQTAGFRETYRRPRYYTDTNEDAIIMSLDLSIKRTYRCVTNKSFAVCAGQH